MSGGTRLAKYPSLCQPQVDPLQLWEWDVKEMSPSMDRDRVFSALQTFHDILVKRRGKRGKEILFAINRFDRKLDRLGTGYGKYFTNLTFSDVANFCTYDIYHNDLFVFCNRILRQKCGLAIGGTGSAQLAFITLSVAEELFYPCITPVALDTTGHHPADLPVHPARFRDNIIGLKYASTPVSDIQANMEAMYALDLQVGSEGDTLKTVEGLLSLEHHNMCPYIRIFLWLPDRTEDRSGLVEKIITFWQRIGSRVFECGGNDGFGGFLRLNSILEKNSKTSFRDRWDRSLQTERTGSLRYTLEHFVTLASQTYLCARCSMHATTHHAQTTHTYTDFASHVLLGV